MSSNGSYWISRDGESNAPIAVLSSSSIEEITASLENLEEESDRFVELGCYFYRMSLVILELQTSNTALDIMEMLSRRIDSAKEIVVKRQANDVMEKKLREVIYNMGRDLSSIPSKTFHDLEFVELSIKSLSKEMTSARVFEITEPKETEEEEEVDVKDISTPLPIVEVDTDLYSAVSIDDKYISTPSREVLPMVEVETDLYSVSIDYSIENFPSSKGNRLRNSFSYGNVSPGGNLSSLPKMAQYMEPHYEAFFCPLTNKIMDEPVTLETGATFERAAIVDWLGRFKDPKDFVCPKTGNKLLNRSLSTNIALKATIEEWKERNEVARVKCARAALSLANSESMVLEAMNELESISQRKNSSRLMIREMGILSLLVRFLMYRDRNVRCSTLQLLLQLAQDDEGKEMVFRTVDMTIVIRMLSSGHQPIRNASLSLLKELSCTQSMAEKIGSITGGILMLITIKYRESVDASASEKAGDVLKNLEKCSINVKRMAENGFLEPLLRHLAEGTEEMKTEMANYLAEVVLGHESKTVVAEKASPALIKMVQSDNYMTRNAAFKALNQISSYKPNATVLVEAGIVKNMVEEIFLRNTHKSEYSPLNSRIEASTVLANLIESEVELDNVRVNQDGHSITSEYMIYNIISLLKNTTPDGLNINLIRVLFCLMKSERTSSAIISVVKETDASYSLIELINNPTDELSVAATKLLISLSPYMGNTLAERLCKTRGQPENLIVFPSEMNRITEKQTVSANFLAKLPHQNLQLNLNLLNKNTVPVVLQRIKEIQTTSIRTSRHANSYLEGLVGILVRFTSTLYDYQILILAKTYNLTSVFTDLLAKTSSDEIRKLSAIGLENLSLQSSNLSKLPPAKKRKLLQVFLRKCGSFRQTKETEPFICSVHRGVCSAQDTFCLVEAKAVERLLACLESEKTEVIEAVLSALSTLLKENVVIEKSVIVLNGLNAMEYLLSVVREHREEVLWRKVFWIMERLLIGDGSDRSVVSDTLSRDKLLPSILVNAFHHGDGYTRQTAENILRYLNRMPNFTSDVTMTMSM
ncbi:putative U-box domain-containing protein 42 [Impatiens glandulifera]|uniref:putative U-box domain-containing protein 42 n=1 Tax=Impatiens glandulifera TaxID=253017 RepID=UPI001FB1491B|nr:putative U-box domain-containing protein 42 [Impatiens glandulifera]